MNRWVSVDDRKYRNNVTDYRAGVARVSSMRSPYDIPEQLRIEIGEDGSCWLILEFRYIVHEATHEIPLDGHAVALVGQNSDRLYKVKVDLKKAAEGTSLSKLSPEWLMAQLSSAVTSYTKWAEHRDATHRWMIFPKLVSDYRSDLIRDISSERRDALRPDASGCSMAF